MKDPRYQTVKEKILSGEISTFKQIFDYLPLEIMSRDLWSLRNFGKVLDGEFNEQEIRKLIQNHSDPDSAK